MEPTYDCVIVANGRFPSAPLPLEELRKATALIVCDGAIRKIHEAGLEPLAVIGDLDSIPPELHNLYAEKIHSSADQETNDLTKAVRFVRQAGFRRPLILGATGLREDHTLGNISLLIEYAELFDRIEMLSDYGLFTPLLHSATLTSNPGQQISLFSLHPGGEITTQGLRWEVTARQFTNWWQGTLNQALGAEFTLTLDQGAQVVVYRALVDFK